MKIAYYCQHVLGIGHFHRSLEICRALARRHATTIIVGGPKVGVDTTDVAVFQLPGLQMNAEFQNLEPCNADRNLAEVKAERQLSLNAFFKKFKPDVFLTELYPFGRKAFRFELDPVLRALRDGTLSPCRCYSSVRDILVERPDDREQFEQRAVTTLNTLFDGLLIHSDQDIISLDSTFGRAADIRVPVSYTGFVTRQQTAEHQSLRQELQLTAETKLIVASIGGGNVGTELLTATLQAFHDLAHNETYRLQMFTGPYCDSAVVDQLNHSLPPQVRIERFTDIFPSWLQAADLSISMAGYNTCMNIVQAGVPALVYPFGQNREQLFRAQQLQKKAEIAILSPADLQPEKLGTAMLKMLQKSRHPVSINLNGAAESVRQIEAWHPTSG